MCTPATLSQPGDELLYPCFEGVKLPNPGHHIGLQTPGRGMYPNGCPVQFGARYGDSAGLYFAAQDGTGQVKGFELSNSMGEWVRMDLTHYTPEVPGAGLVLGYDTVVGTFGRGGWRAQERVASDEHDGEDGGERAQEGVGLGELRERRHRGRGGR